MDSIWTQRRRRKRPGQRSASQLLSKMGRGDLALRGAKAKWWAAIKKKSNLYNAEDQEIKTSK